MAMNNDNVNELLEGLNKKQKRMKEVDEQLSSIDIEIEYYKGEIKALYIQTLHTEMGVNQQRQFEDKSDLAISGVGEGG